MANGSCDGCCGGEGQWHPESEVEGGGLATEGREPEEMPQKSQRLSQVESRKSKPDIGNSPVSGGCGAPQRACGKGIFQLWEAPQEVVASLRKEIENSRCCDKPHGVGIVCFHQVQHLHILERNE